MAGHPLRRGAPAQPIPRLTGASAAAEAPVWQPTLLKSQCRDSPARGAKHIKRFTVAAAKAGYSTATATGSWPIRGCRPRRESRASGASRPTRKRVGKRDRSDAGSRPWHRCGGDLRGVVSATFRDADRCAPDTGTSHRQGGGSTTRSTGRLSGSGRRGCRGARACFSFTLVRSGRFGLAFGNAHGLGHQLMEECQPLGDHFPGERIDAGRVAARPREAGSREKPGIAGKSGGAAGLTGQQAIGSRRDNDDTILFRVLRACFSCKRGALSRSGPWGNRVVWLSERAPDAQGSSALPGGSGFGRHAGFSVRRPKKRGPDQRVPVMAKAICVRLR
jgi:hypothetical protein